MLGDGVGGRANVTSDKEFAEKNKALRTSNRQTSGKRKLFFTFPYQTSLQINLGNEQKDFIYTYLGSLRCLNRKLEFSPVVLSLASISLHLA